jgi:hypothetical protein
MARHDDRSSGLVAKGRLPVARAPFRRPPSIDRDHPQPSVGGHAGQQILEPSGRDAADSAAKALAAGAAAQGLPAGLAGVGEVEILDRDGVAAACLGLLDAGSHRCPQPSVTDDGRLPVKVEGDRVRCPDRVAGWVQHPAGQMVGVEVDVEQPVAAKLLQRRRLDSGELPVCIQVPAATAPGRVQVDVVADRAAGGLYGPLMGAMGEPHRAPQPVGGSAAGGVGQVRQRSRQADL